MKLDNFPVKRVLMTGGSFGFGNALACALINKGFDVYSLDVKEPISGVSKKFHHIFGDVSHFDGLKRSLGDFLPESLQYDLLISNAGILTLGDYEDVIDKTMAVNYEGAKNFVCLANKLTIPETPILVTSSSSVDDDINDSHPRAYVESKKKLDNLALKLNKEVDFRNRIKIARLGPMETDLFRNWADDVGFQGIPDSIEGEVIPNVLDLIQRDDFNVLNYGAIALYEDVMDGVYSLNRE